MFGTVDHSAAGAPGPLPWWVWLAGTLGVALLGVVGQYVAVRRNRTIASSRFDKLEGDHGDTSSRLADILDHVLHVRERQDDIVSDVRKLDEKVDAHLDHHRENEGRWLGPDRRQGGDRRSGGDNGGPPDGIERRRGTDRRSATVADL